MKRRSILGRRSRAPQQSPTATQCLSQTANWGKTTETPRATNIRERSPAAHPFSTPASSGSLSALGFSDTDAWSVFKSSNIRSLKSPINEDGRDPNMDTSLAQTMSRLTTGPTSRLNKWKTVSRPLNGPKPLNILPPKTTDQRGGLQDSSSFYGKEGRFYYSTKLNTALRSVQTSADWSKRGKTEQSNDGSTELNHNAPLIKDTNDSKRINIELEELKNRWNREELRSVSPPWSNGTFTDFNFSSVCSTPTLNVASSKNATTTCISEELDSADNFGVTPLETTVIEKIPEKTENISSPHDRDYTILKNTATQDENTESNCLDLRSALKDVPLGVNSVDLLENQNISLSNTSWASKYQPSPLIKIEEETESLVDKENMYPSEDDIENISPTAYDNNETLVSEINSPQKTLHIQILEYQDRLNYINSKIDIADEKRIQAEEERRQLEVERKQVNIELFKLLEHVCNTAFQPPTKRFRQMGPAKKKPSYVASKLLKRDFRSPKLSADIASSLRTPSRVTESLFKMMPYTPKTLKKSLNQQLDFIFEH